MSAQGKRDGGSKRSVWTRVNAGGGGGVGSYRSVGASMYRSGRVCVFVCEEEYVYMCVCVCVCVRARARVCVCVAFPIIVTNTNHNPVKIFHKGTNATHFKFHRILQLLLESKNFTHNFEKPTQKHNNIYFEPFYVSLALKTATRINCP